MNPDEENRFRDAVENGALCNFDYCSFFIDGHWAAPSAVCEGRWCRDARENFKEAHST